MKKFSLWALFAVIAINVFFKVTVSFEWTWPDSVNTTDDGQEALFEQCYADRDEEIHRTAFGTIDNPDVQKEFITNSRTRARSDCRREFPEKTTEVETPFRFNLIDLAPRFW